MTASIAKITLLADRPDLAAAWAVERTQVPVAFLALGPADAVLGGVGVH